MITATFQVLAGIVITPAFLIVPLLPEAPAMMYTSRFCDCARLPRYISNADHGPWLLSAACGMMFVK